MVGRTWRVDQVSHLTKSKLSLTSTGCHSARYRMTGSNEGSIQEPRKTSCESNAKTQRNPTHKFKGPGAMRFRNGSMKCFTALLSDRRSSETGYHKQNFYTHNFVSYPPTHHMLEVKCHKIWNSFMVLFFKRHCEMWHTSWMKLVAQHFSKHLFVAFSLNALVFLKRRSFIAVH
jgi:hypothetical protein